MNALKPNTFFEVARSSAIGYSSCYFLTSIDPTAGACIFGLSQLIHKITQPIFQPLDTADKMLNTNLGSFIRLSFNYTFSVSLLLYSPIRRFSLLETIAKKASSLALTQFHQLGGLLFATHWVPKFF